MGIYEFFLSFYMFQSQYFNDPDGNIIITEHALLYTIDFTVYTVINDLYNIHKMKYIDYIKLVLTFELTFDRS